MIEYAGIYLKKQNPECARILTVSVHDAVHSTGHCTNYWAVIEAEAYSEHC